MAGNARSSGYDLAANEWYVESAASVDALLGSEKIPLTETLYDPACGGGNIPTRCAAAGYFSFGTDLINRGFGNQEDFLATSRKMDVTVVTNPPFSLAQKFVEHALEITTGRVIVLQRLAWLEGQKRRVFFENAPLSHVWVHSSRISMPPGGTAIEPKGGAVAYAWFVFRRPGHSFGQPWSGGFLL